MWTSECISYLTPRSWGALSEQAQERAIWEIPDAFNTRRVPCSCLRLCGTFISSLWQSVRWKQHFCWCPRECCFRTHGGAQQLLSDARVCRGPRTDTHVLVSGLVVQSRVALVQRGTCVLSPHPHPPQLPSLSAVALACWTLAISFRVSFRLQILSPGCACFVSFPPHPPWPGGIPFKACVVRLGVMCSSARPFWNAALTW